MTKYFSYFDQIIAKKIHLIDYDHYILCSYNFVLIFPYSCSFHLEIDLDLL